MKSSVFFFLAIVVVLVSAIPVFEDVEELGTNFQDDFAPLAIIEEPTQGLRYKRATCDALSFSSKWLTVNHSACAIHCIAKGFRGGKCVDTICNCRR